MTLSLGDGRPILAFDVGGTDIKSALFDTGGKALGVERTPSPLAGSETPVALTARLAELAADLTSRFPHTTPTAAGVIVPGIVDSTRGIGVYASNLGWRDAPIRDLASGALGMPVAFDHDVRAAAWAEHLMGGARAFDDVFVMVIGTGIAGSLIVDGRLHPAGGYAGEIGHSPVAGGTECPCGAYGCLETVASAGAIARRYGELSGYAVDGAREVFARAAAGDAVATAVVDAAIDALVLSLAQLTAMLAPQAVVIGGGLSRAGEALFGPLRTRLDARLSFHRRPQLLPAQLGEDAGLLGAAIIARERSDAAA
jgi:glucokinase